MKWLGILAVVTMAGCGNGGSSNPADGGNGEDGSNGGGIGQVACGEQHTVGEYPKCLELGDEIIRCCLEEGETQSECERQARAYLGTQCTGALNNQQDPDLFCQTALLNFATGCP